MPNMIFVNLPASDLDASKAFYAALGFTLNEQFSDEQTASFVISDAIVAMVMTEKRFAEFTKQSSVADAGTAREVINALGAESREEVDRIADAGLAAGGTQGGETQDHGFMYGRSVDDPDGHRWEFVWMDPSAMEG
ncbi:Glyoxalase family protein [Pseudonocardia sp. Ae168_Ps1]|jgi:predicted lactoylglutathione lyase|uniref:VOC family protein n=1 Tax=unclassified Pseudonocardia TaxID=2619320 RepID=UPI0006CAF8DD|nr:MULTISPECIES: VOC family protein [unclassified Pseudonocardia]ALE75696.1 glyoxalase [Pseudonocardia sp. EC080625-04]ALL75078.1 glyoxalase [Pseudonocardia sp. EC080610-09]ALL82100.1 glyoxalase [Pseudonocardia sp. EC080619-01]OLL74790.1 Glyoxalase family protein [Pseudonocardia sp. Ae150A_Ps1]OLL80782.1 Glyoxalase family protein [Pseudonocardia sp. Ae168_Ps1]